MAGHTDVFILSQPYISGTEHINSDGELDSIVALTAPFTLELSVETEAGNADVQWTDADTLTLAQMVEDINGSALSSLVLAEDFEGCLRLSSLGSGYVSSAGSNAYIKIVPNSSGATFIDAAELFGFPRDPHPHSIVTAGDLASAPVRPLTQVNRPGVSYIARGEDRVSQNFNRALHQLGINDDSLNTRLKTRVPIPTVLDLGEASSRLIVNADGEITAVNLSPNLGDDLDSVLENRVFVGGELNSDTTLHTLSQYFAVLDGNDNEIVADHLPIRVGAATRGAPLVAVPYYQDEESTPTSSGSGPIADTVYISGGGTDGGNVLGVQREKQAIVTIDEIRDHCVLICNGALFETEDVQPGDIAQISGSTLNAPINHDGAYIVERVISETELEVRPRDHAQVHLLNEGSAGLGGVQVGTDGEFEENVFLMFYPPIPRFPPARPGPTADPATNASTIIPGILRLVVGIEGYLGEVPPTFLMHSTINSAEEVDAFTSRRIWRRLSFDGIYQGQGYDYRGTELGGGAEGRVTHGAITFALDSHNQGTPLNTLDKSGSGELIKRERDVVLEIATPGSVIDQDIGKIILLTQQGGGTDIFIEEPFLISEFLSYDSVRLSPMIERKSFWNSVGVSSLSVDYQILQEGLAAIQAAMTIVAPQYNEAGNDAPRIGHTFVRTRENRTGSELLAGKLETPGTSLLHIERIQSLRAGYGGTDWVAAETVEIRNLGTGDPYVSFYDKDDDTSQIEPQHNPSIFARDHNPDSSGSNRLDNSIGHSIVRVFHGPNAGFYSIVLDDSVGTKLQRLSLTGEGEDYSAVALPAGMSHQYGCLYNIICSIGSLSAQVETPLDESTSVEVGITAFADAATATAVDQKARAIQAHWLGDGTAFFVRANDPGWIGYNLNTSSAGPGGTEAASGWAIDIEVFNPANGIWVKSAGDITDSSEKKRRAKGIEVYVESNEADPEHQDLDEGSTPILSKPQGFGLKVTVGPSGKVQDTREFPWHGNDPAIIARTGVTEDGSESTWGVSDITIDKHLINDDKTLHPVTSTVVVQDRRGGFYDSSGASVSPDRDDPVETIELGYKAGAMTVSGSVNIHTWSTLISDSGIGSSVSVYPTYGPSATQEGEISVHYGEMSGFGMASDDGVLLGLSYHTSVPHAAHLGWPRIDLGHDANCESGRSISVTGQDYETFKCKHQFIMQIPGDQEHLTADEIASLVGRVVSIEVSGESDDFTHWRIEGVRAGAAEDHDNNWIYLALRNDTSESDPSSAPNRSIIKASRWVKGCVDVAEWQLWGTGNHHSAQSLPLFVARRDPVERDTAKYSADQFPTGDPDPNNSLIYPAGFTAYSQASRFHLGMQRFTQSAGDNSLEGGLLWGGGDLFLSSGILSDAWDNDPTDENFWSEWVAGGRSVDLTDNVSSWFQPASPFPNEWLWDTTTAPQWAVGGDDPDGYYAVRDHDGIDSADQLVYPEWREVWGQAQQELPDQTQDHMWPGTSKVRMPGESLRVRDFVVEVIDPNYVEPNSDYSYALMGGGSIDAQARASVFWSPTWGGSIAFTQPSYEGSGSSDPTVYRVTKKIGSHFTRHHLDLEVHIMLAGQWKTTDPANSKHSFRLCLRNSRGEILAEDIVQGDSDREPYDSDDGAGNGWRLYELIGNFRSDSFLTLGEGTVQDSLDVPWNKSPDLSQFLAETDVLQQDLFVSLELAVTGDNYPTDEGFFLTQGSGTDGYVPQPYAAHLLRFETSNKTQPVTMSSPIDVQGQVRANTYRYLTPRRETQTIGPESANFLTGTQYSWLNTSVTSASSQNAGKSAAGAGEGPTHGYVASKGTASIVGTYHSGSKKLQSDTDLSNGYGGIFHPWLHVGGSSYYGGSTNTPISETEYAHWRRPYVEWSKCFQRGPDCLRIEFDRGQNDPLWYALRNASWKTTQMLGEKYFWMDRGDDSGGHFVAGSSSTYQPQPQSYTCPGPAGFIVPLDPPHGSRIVEVAYHVSIAPNVWLQNGRGIGNYSAFEDKWTTLDISGGAPSDIGNPNDVKVFADWNCFLEVPTLTEDSGDGESPPDASFGGNIISPVADHWRERSGFRVELWRKPVALGFDHASWENFSWNQGGAELIHSWREELWDSDGGEYKVDPYSGFKDNDFDAEKIPHETHSGKLYGGSGDQVHYPNEFHISRTKSLDPEADLNRYDFSSTDNRVYMVDRRAYTYFLVIRAWMGGPRVNTRHCFHPSMSETWDSYEVEGYTFNPHPWHRDGLADSEFTHKADTSKAVAPDYPYPTAWPSRSHRVNPPWGPFTFGGGTGIGSAAFYGTWCGVAINGEDRLDGYPMGTGDSNDLAVLFPEQFPGSFSFRGARVGWLKDTL